MLLVFRGERASLFWTGLIVLGLASWVLFASIWSSMRTLLDLYFYFYSTDIAYNLPAFVGSVIFILIGFLMMKSGVKEKCKILEHSHRLMWTMGYGETYSFI